jgi:hypothetical protein
MCPENWEEAAFLYPSSQGIADIGYGYKAVPCFSD